VIEFSHVGLGSQSLRHYHLSFDHRGRRARLASIEKKRTLIDFKPSVAEALPRETLHDNKRFQQSSCTLKTTQGEYVRTRFGLAVADNLLPLQLRVLRFGLLQDRDVGVGVLPECEDWCL
jgi:hypothetical protein